MKTILQLVIAALVVHGCVRMGDAVWRNLRFKDAVEQQARFAGSAPTAALHQRILELAEEHEIVIDPGDVVVTRRGQETYVATSYREAIPLVPGFYTRDHVFAFEIRARMLTLDSVK